MPNVVALSGRRADDCEKWRVSCRSARAPCWAAPGSIGKVEFTEIGLAKRCIVGQQKLVELRRRKPAGREQVVYLAPVVDLVKEEMSKNHVDGILARVTIRVCPASRAFEFHRGQPITKNDQLLVVGFLGCDDGGEVGV